MRLWRTYGERYYIADVTGYPINPAGNSTRPATTYAVLDRDWCHREMGVFTPDKVNGARWAKKQAERLCDQLNRVERVMPPTDYEPLS